MEQIMEFYGRNKTIYLIGSPDIDESINHWSAKYFIII